MDQKPQILIVEDNEKFLLSVCQALETAGFEPVRARNGGEATRLAAERSFDLALIEEHLPDASAEEVCRSIKASQPTFVVMLSDRLQDSQSPTEELANGVDGLIMAPVSDRELLAHVRAYLRIQQTQAALTSSEARFQSFVDQASEGIMMLDEQGLIVEFNPAMEEITGLLAQQVLGQTAWDFQFQLVLEEHRTPAFYNRIKTRWLEAILTGQSAMLDNPVGAIFRRADGSQRFVSQSLFPIKTEAGFRIGGIARDVTEQKRAQEALRESEANFRSVFENNTVGLYRTTPDGRILMANPALLQMLGVADFASLAQRNLEESYFNPSYPRSAFKQQIESQGEVKDLEAAWKKEDGSYVYVTESARVVYNQAGEALYYEGTVEDITERKKAEQAVNLLVDTQKRIAQLESPQEIYQLVGKVVHQIIGDGYVFIAKSDELTHTFKGVEKFGFDSLNETTLARLGVDPFSFTYYFKDVSPANMRLFSGTQLEKFTGGLFELTTRKLPKAMCEEAEKQMSLAGIYVMGFIWKDDHFGTLSILAKAEIDPYKEMIETIVNQASISIKRIQSDLAVRLERDRAQLYLNSADFILAVANLQDELTMINQPGCRMLGYSADELIGKDWVDAWVPVRLRDKVRTALRQYAAGEGEAKYHENQVVTKSGEERTVAWQNTVLKDEQGNVIGVMAAGMDITQRKQAEQALEWERHLMRALMDNVPYAIYFKDLQSRIFLANQNMLTIQPGLKSLEEIYGKTDFDFFQPETARVMLEHDQTVIRTGQPLVDLEEEEKWLDRPTTWGLSTIIPLRDAEGSIIGTIGVSSDITRRKQAEEALRQSEEHYHSLFENASFGIFHSLPDGRFLRVNPALAHMLGYSSAEEMVSFVTNIATQLYANPNRHVQALATVTQQDDWLHAENLYRRKDGSLITGSLAVRRVTNPDGTLAYLEGFVEDITERRRIENELRLDEKRLEGLLDISQHAAEGIDELLAFAVHQVLELTGSRVAYLFSYDDQKKELTLNLRSIETADGCGVTNPKNSYRLDEVGLGAEPIRQGKPVLVNDFKSLDPLKLGYLQGHIQIDRFLSIPIFSQERIVAVVAVANKTEGYDQSDIRQMTLLMNSVWRMVETKQAEERLRESEERLRFALEAGNDGLWDHDEKMGRDYYSPRYYSMLGYQPNEFKANQAAFEKLVHPEDFSRVQQALDDYSSGLTEKYEIEFRMLSKSGDVVWILSRAKAVEYDPQGRPCRLVGTHTDITRRKLAEQALAASEESYRGLMKQASDGIFITDEWGRYLDVNQAGCDMLGYTRQEILSFSMQDLVVPSNQVSVPVRLGELRSGKSTLSERRLRCKDGSTIPVEISGKMLEDRRILGIVRDISERRQAEEALRASEQRFRQVGESTGDFIWEEDLNGLFLYASPAVEKILGYTPNELVKKKCWHDLLAPHTAQAGIDGFQAIYAKKESYRDLPIEFMHKDGRIVILESSGSPVLDADGNLLGYRGADTDVTERMRAEQALHESEDRFRTLFEQAAVGVALLETKSGRYLRINQKYCDFLGYTREEMLNFSLQDVTSPDDCQENLDNNALLMQGKIKEFTLEKRYLRKDGAIVWGLLTASPLWKPGETPDTYVHIAAVQDITTRKQAEEQLRESEARLKEAERMAHLGSSTWDVSTDTTYWSDEMYRITGWAPGSPTPKRAERGQLYTPESWARLEPALDRALTVAEPYDLELDLVRPDGSLRQVHVHGEAETGVNGQVVHLHGTVQDITELRLAQENLRQTNQLLNAMVEASPLGISAHDREGRLTLWSPACERLFGWTQAEVLGHKLPTIPDGMQAEVDRQILEEMAGIQRTGFVNPRRRKDGTILDISLSTAPLRDAQGKITGSMAIYEDITQRLQVERTLQESEARLVEAQAIAHVGNWELNLADKNLWASAEAFRIYGVERTSPNLPLEKVQKIPVAADRPRLDAALAGLIRGQGQYDEEFTIQGVNDAAQRVIHSIAHLVCDANGRPCKVNGVIQDITERKQAEEAVRESETRFRAIFENSRDAIGVSYAGVNTSVNPAYWQLFGYQSAEEMIGRSLFDLVAVEERPKVMEISRKRTLGQNAPGYYETRSLRKDGTTFDVEIKASVFELQGKRYTLSVLRDVTERRQAEETLRRSEERYRMLAENMTDTIWVFSMDLKYTYISPSMLRQRGYTLEEINTIPLTSQVSPESYTRAIQVFQETLKPESLANPDLPPLTIELELIRKDGSTYWSENTYILVRDRDGKPAGILGSGRDVTERKRTEQALRESEQRFRTFIEQSAEGVMIVDEEGRIIEWNEASERTTGLTRQQAIGNYYWDMQDHFVSSGKHSQQLIERTRHALLRALRTGQSAFFNRAIETEIICSDGNRRFIRQTVFPIKTEKGFRLGGVSQDITEMKQAEDLRLARDAAEAANRSKSEFLANMSHELRTPLNAVIGFSDMLSQQYYGPLTVKQVEYVKDIHESATYLLALINDILDLSKIEAGRMDLETSRINLRDVFDHSLVMVRERASKHALYLSSYIDPHLEPLTLMADERKVRQVLYNLLANAVKFTPDGGAVDVSARLVDEVEGQGQPWVEISVSDTGIGLAAKDLERVFEAFYQVKSVESGKTPGTGLGLSLVRRMVELHGGKVWAESKGPGWGSRFVFTLPAGQPGETL